MINTNVTDFSQNIYDMIKQTVLFNEPVNISTNDGNAVLMSESDYRGLMETLYLCSIPGMKEKILESANTPLEECVSESEVKW